MIQTQKRKQRLCLSAVLAATASVALSAQTIIPASSAVPVSAADATKPGFIFRIHQSGSSQANSVSRAEAQIAGQLGTNIAEPTEAGGADGPATAANPASAPIEFVVSSVINFDQNGAESGSIPGDTSIPGISSAGNTDNIAAEALTWLELPAGEIVMGVNSDDGFKVTIGGAVPTDPFATKVGEFDGGRGQADSIFRFNVTQAGLYAARLLWFEGGSDARVEWWTQKSDGTKVLINNVAEGGLKAYRGVTGSGGLASLSKFSPGINQANVAPNASIEIELREGGTAIDPATVRLSLDGSPLGVTATKTGNLISARFTPASLFAPASPHQVSIAYTEGSVTKSNTWNFTVAGYGTLLPAAKVTPDTTKPGFIWNFFANSAATATTVQRAGDALAGLLKDADGNTLINNADPSNQGVALAAAAAPSPATAPISFEIPGVINLTQNALDDADNRNGNFVPDLQMPGVPSDTEGLAAEALTFIELPAGLLTMGINSDDGFSTTAGNPQDVFLGTRLGEFNAGRGAGDSIFYVLVQEAGVYAFRTLWFEGTGGANIEWFTVKSDGSKVLVNDTANGGLKAYRALTGGTQPVVSYISPTIINRIERQSSTNLVIGITDGTSAVDDNSISLKVDGQPVTITKARAGDLVTVTYAPTTLSMPYELRTAELTFNTVGGTNPRTQQWSFRNLRHLVLPTAAVTENFDSTEEGSVPTGWVEKNFTSVRTAGIDLDDLNSDAYLGWVVVSRARLETLKGRIFNVAPGQTLNGQEVTSLSEGNLLYAESDVRGGDQVQFITSRPFNLSTLTNVVMSFSSLYEQNQDSIGAIEYSVDGGTSWLPVLYYIDALDGGGDIIYNPDGTIDAVTTLTRANADTAAWVDNGVAKGDKYGDALLAPITSALNTYIAPRHNDDNTIDKLIEVVRLPQAGGKSDVRLRFAQLGTGSWYFGVDNIAFHEGPAPAQTAGGDTVLSIAKAAAGPITLSWTGAGTLESSDRIQGAWSNHSSQENPQTITATGTRFFRVKRN